MSEISCSEIKELVEDSGREFSEKLCNEECEWVLELENFIINKKPVQPKKEDLIEAVKKAIKNRNFALKSDVVIGIVENEMKGKVLIALGRSGESVYDVDDTKKLGRVSNVVDVIEKSGTILSRSEYLDGVLENAMEG